MDNAKRVGLSCAAVPLQCHQYQHDATVLAAELCVQHCLHVIGFMLVLLCTDPIVTTKPFVECLITTMPCKACSRQFSGRNEQHPMSALHGRSAASCCPAQSSDFQAKRVRCICMHCRASHPLPSYLPGRSPPWQPPPDHRAAPSLQPYQPRCRAATSPSMCSLTTWPFLVCLGQRGTSPARPLLMIAERLSWTLACSTRCLLHSVPGCRLSVTKLPSWTSKCSR